MAAARSSERIHYRCTLCRDQQSRAEHQASSRPTADRERAARDVGAGEVRRRLRDRFPVPEGGGELRRRDPRPPHGSPAGGPRGDPRADRGRPARGTGRVGAAAGVPARRAAREPAGPRRPADPADPDRRRNGPGHRAGPVARAQPVARVRGRVPAGPRRSSSASRAGRSGRSRRGSARTCGASSRVRTTPWSA